MDNTQTTKPFITKLNVSQEDINRFAEISGDNNPIHIDLEFAAKSKFGKTICHGMLLYSLINEYLNKHFPQAIEISQTLSFLSPVYAQEELTLVQETLELEKTVEVKTTITKPDGKLACQSLATLQIS